MSLRCLSFRHATLGLGGTCAGVRGPSSFRSSAGRSLRPPCIGRVSGTGRCSIPSISWSNALPFVAGFLIFGPFGPLPVLVPSFRMAGFNRIAWHWTSWGTIPARLSRCGVHSSRRCSTPSSGVPRVLFAFVPLLPRLKVRGMAGLSLSSPATLSWFPNFPEGLVSSVGVEGLLPDSVSAIWTRARLRSPVLQV